MVKHFETNQQKQGYLSKIREQAYQEVDVIALKKRQRFGLFSQPPPLAISDNSYDHVVNVKRNEQGKPETQPRQIQTTILKKGKIKSSYFQLMSFISIGDKYQDQYKLKKLDEMQNKSKIPKDIMPFKYSDGFKIVIKPPYEHKSDFTKQEKKYTNENGRVIIQSRNIQTGPVIKGLYKFPHHIKDEYNRYQQNKSKEREENQKKIKDLPPFKSMNKTKEYFNSLKDLYYDDPNIKKKQKKQLDFNSLSHDAPFKYSNPPKLGYNKTIGKFPAYMPDILKQIVRKNIDPELKKESFKINNPQILTRPTPSISFNPTNIRQEIRKLC